jgi:hypothetical protein
VRLYQGWGAVYLYTETDHRSSELMSCEIVNMAPVIRDMSLQFSVKRFLMLIGTQSPEPCGVDDRGVHTGNPHGAHLESGSETLHGRISYRRIPYGTFPQQHQQLLF